MTPRVSFVIVNWNGRHLLQECLSSVLVQDYQDFEILLVDNGSNDDSVAYVREKFPQVKLIQLSENQGFAGPNNLAFQNAQGSYVATINNDLTLDPSWLGVLLAKLDSDPDCFSVQGKILRADERTTIDTCGLGMRPCGAARNLGHNKSEIIQSPIARPIFTASAGAALYRQSMLQMLSFFDPTYFAYYEDLDLGWRARLKGWHSAFVPEARAYHKVHGTSANVPGNFLWFLSERNRIRTMVKNLPLRAFLRHPFRILLDELRYMDMIRKKAGWKTLFHARAQILKELPFLIRQRMPELQKFGSVQWEQWLKLSE